MSQTGRKGTWRQLKQWAWWLDAEEGRESRGSCDQRRDLQSLRFQDAERPKGYGSRWYTDRRYASVCGWLKWRRDQILRWTDRAMGRQSQKTQADLSPASTRLLWCTLIRTDRGILHNHSVRGTQLHNCPPQVQRQMMKSLGTTFLTFHNQIRVRPVHRTLWQTNRYVTWVNIILRDARESSAIKTVAGSSSSSPPLTSWMLQASWSLFKHEPSPRWAFLVALTVKNPPAMWGTWARSLVGRSPGGKMATHSRILAWRIPWTEESGGLQSTGSQKSQTWLSK